MATIRTSTNPWIGTYYCPKLLSWKVTYAVGCCAICQLQKMCSGKTHPVLSLACHPLPQHTQLLKSPSMIKSKATLHTHTWMHWVYCGVWINFGCGLQHKLGCSLPALHLLPYTQPGHIATTLDLSGTKLHAHKLFRSQTQACQYKLLWLLCCALVGRTKRGGTQGSHCHGGLVEHKCPNKPQLPHLKPDATGYWCTKSNLHLTVRYAYT